MPGVGAKSALSYLLLGIRFYPYVAHRARLKKNRHCSCGSKKIETSFQGFCI